MKKVMRILFIGAMPFFCACLLPRESPGWYSFEPGRIGHTAIVFAGKMWIIGGNSGDVWYTSDGDNWTEALHKAPWGNRMHHTSVVFDNKMWVIGGQDRDKNWHSLNDVWCSSDGTNWKQVTHSAKWAPRHYHTSVVFDNKMWVIGGSYSPTDDGCYDDVWYSTDGSKWIRAGKNTPWLYRSQHTTIVFDSKMWVIGGRIRDESFRNVNYHPYSPDGETDVWYSGDGVNWKQANFAPWNQRLGHTAVVYDNKIWVMGGYNWTYQNDVWYSKDGMDWMKATDEADWNSRSHLTCVVFNDKMWVYGGCGERMSYNDVRYSSDGANWTFVNNAPWPINFPKQ